MSANASFEILESRQMLSATPSYATHVTLYSTDPTTGQTQKLFLAKGESSTENAQFQVFENKLFFTRGQAVYMTDGTLAGTKKLIGGDPDISGNPTRPYLDVVDGELFIQLGSLTSHSEPVHDVYYYDTQHGVRKVNVPSETDSFAANLNGVTYIDSVTYAPYTHKLYTLDGQLVAPALANQLMNQRIPDTSTPLTNTLTDNGNTYYAYDDGSHGSELWTSDSNGARLLADVNPGAAASTPHDLFMVNGHVIYLATGPDTHAWDAYVQDNVLHVNGTDYGAQIHIWTNYDSTGQTFVEIDDDKSYFDDASFNSIVVDGGIGAQTTINYSADTLKAAQVYVNGGSRAKTVFNVGINGVGSGTTDATFSADGVAHFASAPESIDPNLDLPAGAGTPPVVEQSHPTPVVKSNPTPVVKSTPWFAVKAGVLTITGTANADAVVVKMQNKNTLVATLNGHSQTFAANLIHKIVVKTGSGTDAINLSGVSIASNVQAGDGNDTVHGSSANDSLFGGNGNDWIDAGAGNDAVYGEAGNDRLFGGAGSDHLMAGAGTDLVRGGGGRDILYASKIDDRHDNSGDRQILA